MLRITVHDTPQGLRFQLEGRLAGTSVQQLEEFWHAVTTGDHEPVRLVDLTGVTYIDTAGQVCLEALHRQGAEFLAADCLTKAAVAEITRQSIPHEGKSPPHPGRGTAG
jgi:hypothetical protein